MKFSDLGLSETVLKAVSDAGYTQPTPIQEQAIPFVLMGRDVLGTAQTGTGKTAGFTLPMIDILSGGRVRARMPRALILEPTRELADQVAKSFEVYGKHNKLTVALLIGGVAYGDQEKALDRGVDVLIATPGRLLDHFERGRIMLGGVQILVIDETDRMMDMGFMPDVERIVKLLPPLRQTLFFSATMPPEIRKLANAFLKNPKEVAVTPQAPAAATVVQGLCVVPAREKREALRRLLKSEPVKNALIFCNRKRDVDILHKSLVGGGFDAAALHGDMAQSVRTETLNRFKAGEIALLVASDVAARGLDVQGMSHVFNYDVPIHAEDYVHRIGRTGRAGLTGHAYTLATPADTKFVIAIEAILGKPIPIVALPGIAKPDAEEMAEASRPRRGGRGSKSAASRHPASRHPAPRHSAPRPAEHASVRPRPEPVPIMPEPPAAPSAPSVVRFKPEPPQPKPPREHRAEPARERGPEPARDSHRAIVGLGDHVPAFLLSGPARRR